MVLAYRDIPANYVMCLIYLIMIFFCSLEYLVFVMNFLLKKLFFKNYLLKRMGVKKNLIRIQA